VKDTRQTTELRLRMGRVAGKPVALPASARRAATARTKPRRRLSSPDPPQIPPQGGQSRLDTLRAWVRWELATVPARRWSWLTAIVFGQSPQRDRSI